MRVMAPAKTDRFERMFSFRRECHSANPEGNLRNLSRDTQVALPTRHNQGGDAEATIGSAWLRRRGKSSVSCANGVAT